MGQELIAEADARSRAYALLARLVAAGPEASTLEAAALDTRMAEAIASYGGDLDALAADHQHVLGLSCPAYESVLLDPEARIGGEIGDRVRRVVGKGRDPADHLASELEALALFAGAEADAEQDAERAIAEQMRARARHLLDAHLLRWLPTLAAAVRRAGRPWPAALLQAIEDVVLQHRSVLGAADRADLAFVLPPLGLSLDDPDTGLAEIALALARPARAGCLVSRDDIAALGRGTGTPRGFGDRATLIENLLHSGAELGSITDVVEALSRLLQSARAELDAGRLADVPPELRAPWKERIDLTCALLDRLREAAAA